MEVSGSSPVEIEDERLAGEEEVELDLQQITKDLYSCLIGATRSSNELPSDDDYRVYSSMSAFKKHTDSVGSKLLQLIQRIAGAQRGVKVPEFEDHGDLADCFESVTDTLDSLLEKVDLNLDEAKGYKQNPLAMRIKRPAYAAGRVSLNEDKVESVMRPQVKWPTDFDNSNRPFVPRIARKANASEASPSLPDYDSLSKQQPYLLQQQRYPHPYAQELSNLTFLPTQLQPSPPGSEQLYGPLDKTPVAWIDSVEQLLDLAAHLQTVSEFAIDLEQHSYRSFQGFVCLMQLSTRGHDYLIDTLELRTHMHLLLDAFTNPKIVKVLHGSDWDVLWLQRDFGLYVVNMFDTGQAARALNYPGFGLAYLLKYFCGVDADKKYQLADWRVRPLPAEMAKYAREDTHYLLYIYDRLRQDLFDHSSNSDTLMKQVLTKSRDLCLKQYEKDLLREDSHVDLMNKLGGQLYTPQQTAVFRALYRWRDRTARREDESHRFVLPNHMLAALTEHMCQDAVSVLNYCAPSPPLVRKYSSQIATLISLASNGKDVDSFVGILPAASSSSSSFQDSYRSNTMVISSSALPALNTPSSVGSRSHMDEMLTSPVMSSDQVFQSAGWIDSSSVSPFANPRANSVSVSIASHQQTNNSSSSSLAIALSFDGHFSSDDEDVEESDKSTFGRAKESIARKAIAVALSPAPSSSLFGSSASASLSEDSEDELNEEEKDIAAKVMEIQKSLSLSQLSFSSAHLGGLPRPQPVAASPAAASPSSEESPVLPVVDLAAEEEAEKENQRKEQEKLRKQQERSNPQSISDMYGRVKTYGGPQAAPPKAQQQPQPQQDSQKAAKKRTAVAQKTAAAGSGSDSESEDSGKRAKRTPASDAADQASVASFVKEIGWPVPAPSSQQLPKPAAPTKSAPQLPSSKEKEGKNPKNNAGGAAAQQASKKPAAEMKAEVKQVLQQKPASFDYSAVAVDFSTPTFEIPREKKRRGGGRK